MADILSTTREVSPVVASAAGHRPAPAGVAPGEPETTVASGADGVLASLLAGNQRFAEGRARHGYLHSPAARSASQKPYALVLGCLDSRVIPEAILDQDFGAVMVVRVGGHVIDAAVLGSVDFAVSSLAVPLVLVLGHQHCGAVAATLRVVADGGRPEGPVGYLVDQIAPAVDDVMGDVASVCDPGPGGVPGGVDPALLDRVVWRHVARTVEAISAVPLVRRRLDAGALRVVGARYDVDTARVELLQP